jgi:hypothetical protein
MRSKMNNQNGPLLPGVAHEALWCVLLKRLPVPIILRLRRVSRFFRDRPDNVESTFQPFGVLWELLLHLFVCFVDSLGVQEGLVPVDASENRVSSSPLEFFASLSTVSKASEVMKRRHVERRGSLPLQEDDLLLKTLNFFHQARDILWSIRQAPLFEAIHSPPVPAPNQLLGLLQHFFLSLTFWLWMRAGD